MSPPPTKPRAARSQLPADMPVFYLRPVPVSPEAFKGKSLVSSGTFRFARTTNFIPINAAEFAHAQRHYPIVFTPEGRPVPLVIFGLRDDENLFVDRDGHWQASAYVPAYIRRYPFIFMNAPGEKRFTLCADMGSELVVHGDSNLLFKDGKPTEITNKALKFCSAFQSQFDKSEQFCDALVEQDVLRITKVDARIANGAKLVFGPVKIIDKAKFSALPERVLIAWHRRDWLGIVHAHFLSWLNWSVLISRTSPKVLDEKAP